jgi:hypothetical protein
MSVNSSGEIPQCKVCGMPSELFDGAQILRKYSVNYFRCMTCGFIQTESPYWLEEAYSSAISRLDTGILYRNDLNQKVTAALINVFFPGVKHALDYGSGHGIFVRLMRDSGYEFSWYDPRATNDYAGGFEHKDGETYGLLTSFEVLEHLIDPVAELSRMMSLSPNVFVSTEILPSPAPKVSEWWYYAPMSGQHISFYTLESLRLVALRFKRNLLSRGPFQLFTTEPKSKILYRIATSMTGSGLLNAFCKRPTLKDSDFQRMSGI